MSTTLPEITTFRKTQQDRETRRSTFHRTDYGGFKPTIKPKHSATLKENRGWTQEQRKDAYLRQIA